jgi:excisionase family DNA binding protein
MKGDGLMLTLPREAIDAIANRAAEIVLERLASADTPPPVSPYLTADEAAAYARCDRQRIYDLRSSGRLTRLGHGGRALILRTELDKLIAKGSDR